MIRCGFVKSSVLIAIVTCVTASAGSGSSWLGPDFVVLQKVYDDCYDNDDFTGCLKGKALVALNKAVDQDSITLFDGVMLEKQNSTDEADTPSIADERSLNQLNGIDKELMTKLDKFLRSHVLKLDMSESRDKKGKKMYKYLMAAVAAAVGISGPLALKSIGIIAGKALIISKVALTIAGILALKKIYSNDSHEETTFQVHTSGDNRRSTYILRPIKPTVKPTTIDPYRYYSSNNFEYPNYYQS
ncbi:uncharacterized protein LOC119085874 isoform X1 [Bradysia coprophila]|uniref:uncharacterized protein LOC119085874 isoform X1 n=1 Tax=Bradysia coprophila TaxID=38358 RepID=UPI00187D7104|nr:uncharacterized protein LOC119085874 isoform X1 [Bradysia coprophila]